MPVMVCFGDSITANELEANGTERLTSRIRGEMVTWDVINAGKHGETSRDGLARFQEDVLHHNPDAVSILFGLHDANVSFSVSVKEFEVNLLYMIQRLTPQKTILISPAPVCEEKQPPRLNEQIERYAKKTTEIAEKTGCYFIDLWTLANRELGFAFDGKTISKTGYEILANKMMKCMEQILLKNH